MFKIYAKVFFWGALFFFLGTLIANLNMLEGVRSILAEVPSSLVFGVMLSSVIGTIHARHARRAAGDKPEGDIYSASQTRQVRLALPYDRVFHVVEHYFKEVARFNVLGADPLSGRMDARTPPAMFIGMGNKITAELARDGEATVVTLRSRPAVPLFPVDYGANLKIVTDAQDYLKEALHQ